MGVNKVIEYEKMREIVSRIENVRTRAMVAAQYALAARAGELVPYTHTKGRITLGLLQSNIVLRKGVYVCNIPNFKNAKQEFKKPFLIPLEGWVYEPVREWLDICGEQVFDLKVSRFRELVDAELPEGYSSHALRHSRATHLAEVFGFSAFEIKNFLGHARLDTSAIYVNADLSRSAQKMEVILRERADNH